MQPMAVLDKMAQELNSQAASAVASVRETAEHAQQVLRQEASQALAAHQKKLGGMALEGLAADALNAVDAELYRLDEEFGKARNVVQSAVGAVVHETLGTPGGLSGGTDRSFTEEPLLRSLPGSSVHRILGRLSRCLDAAAQELGCLALAAVAENTAVDALSGDDLRVQALHAAAGALVTHGTRHSAVALAACDALTGLLRSAARASLPSDACDSLLLAAVSTDAAGAVAAALSAHTADESVQAAGLGALLALLALLPRAATQAARDGALAHVVASQAGDAALSALWTHSGSAGVQAQGAMLMGLLLQHSSPAATADLLARGAAQALVAALRSQGLKGEVAQAACVALLRCACLNDKAVANALRYAAVPDTLRAVLGSGAPPDGVTHCAAQGALLALQQVTAPLQPATPTPVPAAPIPQPRPPASTGADATTAAHARAADLVSKARQDAVRVALQAQEDAVELLRRQMQEAQELLLGHES